MRGQRGASRAPSAPHKLYAEVALSRPLSRPLASLAALGPNWAGAGGKESSDIGGCGIRPRAPPRWRPRRDAPTAPQPAPAFGVRAAHRTRGPAGGLAARRWRRRVAERSPPASRRPRLLAAGPPLRVLKLPERACDIEGRGVHSSSDAQLRPSAETKTIKNYKRHAAAAAPPRLRRGHTSSSGRAAFSFHVVSRR